MRQQLNAIWELGYRAGQEGRFDPSARTLTGKFYTMYLRGVAAGEKSQKIVGV